MALKEYEPIPAILRKKNDLENRPFQCNIITSKNINRYEIVKGMVTDVTKRVISTTNKHLIFERGDKVEVLGVELTINGIAYDENDPILMGARKLSQEYINSQLTKVLVLE